jgi:signal transduction histidine kinase
MMVVLYFFLFFFFNMIGYGLVNGWPWESKGEMYKEVYSLMINKSSIKKNQVKVPHKMLKQMKKEEWMQVLDEQGNEIYQYQKPDHIPKHYSYLQLTDLKHRSISTGYQIYTFDAEKEKKHYTFVFGYAPFDTQLVKKETKLHGNQVRISEQALQEIHSVNAWLQVLDDRGNEIFQYGRPSQYPRHYSPGEFIYYDEKNSLDNHLYYMIDKVQGKQLTWVIGFRKPIMEKYYRSFGMMSSDINQKAIYTAFSGIISFLLSILIVTILFALYFTSPMLHIMQWLKQLAVGVYEEPTKKGIPRSISRLTGELKRSYRNYFEVIQAMKYLTFVLKKNDRDRRKLEKTREEWLAGVSHDLKTPLSAVKGYADLLAEPQYEWSKEEIHQYAEVIREKANYMENLINDLNLTFRLKNDALPLQRKPFNLVELVRRAVIGIMNDPRAEQVEILFETAKETIIYPVDVKWLKRALTNLLVNSVVHNPAGTQIVVRIEQNPVDDQVLIIIEDNGVGMDQKTLTHLFDRYYRGTNTKHLETGTGLGMAIADQLVKAHDGRIEIDSTLGRGTKICLCFSLKSPFGVLNK